MRKLLTELLPLVGIALLWRVAQWLAPSTYMAIVGIYLLIALAMLYVQKMPMAKQTLKWASLIFLGGGLNLAATIGNGGMMPYPHVMSSAWWVWLGDWLPGMFSPGDILVLTGFFGVAITLIVGQRKAGMLAYEK
jgi:hypothetical protein